MSHVYSDDEESPVLHNFVNETIARQTQTPSPRTELLSPTSPRALPGEIDRVARSQSGRSQRGPSERYRRQREQAYANVSSRQLLSLLIEKEYESSRLRKALHRALDRADAEAIRASEAERVAQETLNQFRAINEGKVAAERALLKSNEELRLWKFQFDHAQREITRAQGVVGLVERQRDDAEHAAAKARTAARQLNEQRLVSDAMEEGRRLGYQAGFRRAQQELAYTRGTPAGDVYEDLEREIEDGHILSTVRPPPDGPDSGQDGSPTPSLRDLNASPMPTARSPHIIGMPEMQPPQVPSATLAPPAAPAPPTATAPRVSQAPPPRMPVPDPAMAMPSPIRALPRAFETETVRRAPPSARSPSIQLSHYAIDIPSPSAFNPRPLEETRPLQQQWQQQQWQQQQRPSSQYQGPPPGSIRDVPSRRPTPQPLASVPPDNYIPSITAEGGIALPAPFQLSHPVLPAVPPTDEPRTQSWYNNNKADDPSQTQSWYQQKRPRSNAGSATGRSVAGSATGRSMHGRRHASLDERATQISTGIKNQKLAANGTDLRAIKEDARSSQGTYAYAVPERVWDNVQGAQRSKSMHGSTESLLPPPPPAKDPRHQKQMIADELRYSNPDLAESWRRDAAVNAEAESSRNRPPRNVRKPIQLTIPGPLSPPTGPVPLSHMRARSMSGSTGKSGWSQPPNPVDLSNRPSLRRVKERRPISPSDVGSPFSGTINVEPPSQSSSQIPIQMGPMPPMDQYLSPNYQTQPLPQMQANPRPGFVPQSVTVPVQVTVPVTLKGKSISGPIAFPTEGGGVGYAQQRPTSGMSDYRASAAGSNTSLNRGRSNSTHARSREAEPLPRPLSTSNLSRKSGKSDYVAGPTLTAGHGLAHQASNVSLRSTGSYARFDAKSYVDPAYFAADTAIPVPAPRSRRGSASSHHSGLSYMGPPQG
ncbi:hypothetical protein C8R43DRAFT_184664 [Mycena crocata]|nr:hypothetical protein C8R43DRAFT_184664 [Mycena crocata]